MFEEQMSQSIEAGAPDITYSGNEGPKSPQQEQQQMMMAQLQEQYYRYVFEMEEQGIQPMTLQQFIEQAMAEGQMSSAQQPMPNRQMAAYGGPMDPGRGAPQDEQGKQVAAKIWEQMEPEQKSQFGSFDAFFASGIWKQIIQQMQADESGINSQAPEMMQENVNMAESMPGGGIADVDMREQVQMRANGGLMGLYNRGM